MNKYNKVQEMLFNNINSLDNVDIDYVYYFSNVIENIDENSTAEDVANMLYDELNDSRAFDVEIIYYCNAMKYLILNDNSLKESMTIASELGFELKNINSEVLASLHASQQAREKFEENRNKLEEFFQIYIDILNKE